MRTLDELDAWHTPPIVAILRACHARFGEPAMGVAQSTATLERCHYTPHVAAITFDTRYGGLVMAAETQRFDGTPIGADWSFDDTAGWTFGPSACLTSGTHGSPRGDHGLLERYGDVLQLVPVAYGPQDDIWYVDAIGRGYFHDTCYDIGGPHLIAATPRQLFARIVLHAWRLAAPHRAAQGERWCGAQLAAALDLPVLDDASGELERWWGRERTIVGDTVTLPGEQAVVARTTLTATDAVAHAARLAELLGA